MARAAAKHTAEEWRDIGRAAILDLLGDRLVVPWAEAQARISETGWKGFDLVQPVQLSEARTALELEGLIVRERTEHTPPVITVRLPFPRGRKREIERLRGERRKMFRPYLSWTQDPRLCGTHTENVVLESALSAASAAGLWVPTQSVGRIKAVGDAALSKGPLDVLAHILDTTVPPAADAALLIEVKNIHSWIYPWTAELWELLTKAADLALQTSVVPLLVCVRTGYQANQMAKDVGFFVCYMGRQLFSPSIPAADFETVTKEFALSIAQHEGPYEPISSFFTKILRQSPPWSPPYEEQIPWYRRQRDRFKVLAPLVVKHQALADKSLNGAARTATLASFRAEVAATATWPLVRGW